MCAEMALKTGKEAQNSARLQISAIHTAILKQQVQVRAAQVHLILAGI